MNVGQLINHLSRYPAELPVILSMEDEPLGDYEVASAELRRMQHETTYDYRVRVYHDERSGLRDLEPAQDVVYLDFESWPGEIIDVTAPVER